MDNLVARTQSIAGLWLRRVLRMYPPQTAGFLASEQDSFRNPVGATLKDSLGILLDELLLAMDMGRLIPALDSIVQIQAVQDFPPSKALEFLFQLRDILRGQAPESDLRLFDSRIDDMALIAFNLYVKYREQTWEVRANEARRRVYALERRLQPREQTAWQERGEA